MEVLAGIKGFSIDTTRIGTSSYGVGVGVQFSGGASTIDRKPAREVVEISVRYLRGGIAPVDGQRFAASSHALMIRAGWGLKF
jgi:hypothetical protein